MNKKNVLALTLLLSTISLSVVAEEVASSSTTVQTTKETTKETPKAKKYTRSYSVATEETKDPVYVAVTDKDGKIIDYRLEQQPGIFGSAWDAASSNKVATALLATLCVFAGYVLHAAVSDNNDVVTDEDVE